MRKFIFVISAALIATNAYGWGTSQTAVQRDHTPAAEQTAQVPEAERMWNEKHQQQQQQTKVAATNPVVAGSWVDSGKSTFYKLDDSRLLTVNYGGDYPIVGLTRSFQGPFRTWAPKTMNTAGFKTEIIINGQRLKALRFYQIEDKCGYDGHCQSKRYSENQTVTVYYSTVVETEQGNQWAYRTLKNSTEIKLDADGVVFNVDVSGFKSADSKHSVAF